MIKRLRHWLIEARKKKCHHCCLWCELVAHMRGGQMMEDMIAIELAVIIVAMFAIAVGFDCIKDGMCDIGAVIHDIITAPVRHYRQKKLME